MNWSCNYLTEITQGICVTFMWRWIIHMKAVESVYFRHDALKCFTYKWRREVLSFPTKILSKLNSSLLKSCNLRTGGGTVVWVGFLGWFFFSRKLLKKFHIFSFFLLLNCIFYEGVRKSKQFNILPLPSHLSLMLLHPTTLTGKRSLKLSRAVLLFSLWVFKWFAALGIAENRSAERGKLKWELLRTLK